MKPSKPIAIVYTHAGHDEILRRSEPALRQHFAEVVTVSPLGDQSYWPGVVFGESQKYGLDTIERTVLGFKTAMQLCRRHGTEQAWFLEGDTAVLGKPPELPEGGQHLTCCLKETTLEHYKQVGFDAAAWFPHFPWGLNFGTVFRLFRCCDTLPGLVEGAHGFADRWMALLCRRAGVLMVDSQLQASRNHIAEDGYEEVRHAFKRNPGIWAVHGVKTVEDWNVIQGLKQ